MLPFLSLFALMIAAPIAAEQVSPDGTQWAQLTIRGRIIVRVPRLRADPPPVPVPATPIRWIEKHGDKCVPMAGLAGALVPGPGAVDFVLAGGSRVRARLGGDCHALDFYAGFYVQPDPDGMMCAGRDAVRARSGAVCAIRTFKRLVPAR
jgi:hypothetical protein